MDWSKRFHYYWTEMADPRTNDWPLINSIYEVPFILITYLLIVLYWGPRFMKNKRPYSLKTLVKIYNFCQIIANIWIVRNLAILMKDVPLTCVSVTYSYEPRYYKHTQILWWILLLKIADCIETIIFMLRKKYKQISILHVYHHVSSMIMVWLGVKYHAGEMSTFITMINCSVHILMYIYYFLSAFGPRVQTNLMSIKPIITIFQLVQLFVFILYALQALMPNCHVPKSLSIMFLLNVLINWSMFYKFYQKSYVSSKVKQ